MDGDIATELGLSVSTCKFTESISVRGEGRETHVLQGVYSILL